MMNYAEVKQNNTRTCGSQNFPVLKSNYQLDRLINRNNEILEPNRYVSWIEGYPVFSNIVNNV